MQVASTLLFVCHPYLLLWNVPMLLLCLREYANRGCLSGWALFDPTRILRKDHLYRINCIFGLKIAYYTLTVAVYAVYAVVHILQSYA